MLVGAGRKRLRGLALETLLKGKTKDCEISIINEKSEINVFNEKSPCNELRVISLVSLHSFFSLFVSIKDPAETVAKIYISVSVLGVFQRVFASAFSGVILKSQPAVRGHTLTRYPLPVWRVVVAPTSPIKASKTATQSQPPEPHIFV